jgi:hypothetical protein
MRKQLIQDAAYEVGTQIRAVEDSIDAVLTEMAELQARIMRANSVSAVGPIVIHEALQQLAAGMSGLVATRGSIVGCHQALAEAKQKVPGLRCTMWGDGNECPPPSSQVDLRIVA